MPCLSLMLKPASSLCNMKCGYCFYRDVSSRREHSCTGLMSTETAHNVVDAALDFANGDEISFVFQGGEPLLRGIAFYRDFFEYTGERNADGKIHSAVQTNALLIDGEWAQLFAHNNVLVGVSLDGAFAQNADRVDGDGQSVFHRVLDAAKLLTSSGVDVNIVSVLTAKSCADVEKSYEFFKKNGFHFLQFIPCLDPFGKEGVAMTAKQYASALKTLYRLYSRDLARGEYVSVRRFDNYRRIASGGDAEQCDMAGRCSRQLVIEGDGSVYPCDFYCTDDWLLGNINECSIERLFSTEKAREFLRLGQPAVSKKCASCKYLPMCRAQGCRRSRESRDYCEAYREFFAYVANATRPRTSAQADSC